MAGKKGFLKVIISLLLLIGIIHFAFHILAYGTGISGFYESGVSGFSVGKLGIGEDFKKSYPELSLVSVIILSIEWSSVLIFLILTFIKNKNEIKEELLTILPINYKKSTISTDIDALYGVLKEKKHLRISTIEKIFKVDKETAINWAKTLESINLATINTPKIGEPKVYINE